MFWKIVLVFLFVVFMLLAMFLSDVLCKIASRASEMEEQRDIERKLREHNEKRESGKSKN